MRCGVSQRGNPSRCRISNAQHPRKRSYPTARSIKSLASRDIIYAATTRYSERYQGRLDRGVSFAFSMLPLSLGIGISVLMKPTSTDNFSLKWRLPTNVLVALLPLHLPFFPLEMRKTSRPRQHRMETQTRHRDSIPFALQSPNHPSPLVHPSPTTLENHPKALHPFVFPLQNPTPILAAKVRVMMTKKVTVVRARRKLEDSETVLGRWPRVERVTLEVRRMRVVGLLPGVVGK